MRAAAQKMSVCMATRNGEHYIREQLASILRQLDAADEVIISDDSSDDATLEIIRSFGDARIRLFASQAFNPIFNFENALQRASGDIIVLSDQDDVWLERKVAIIRERFLRSTAAIQLLVLDGEIIDEGGAVLGASIFQKINSGPGLLKNLYDNTFLGCCMAFSRPLLEIALPFPRRIPMHDMWLGMLAQLVGRVEFVPEPTIRYRKHAASLTGFRRKFQPLTQIQRRLFLAWHLGWRLLERKCLQRPGREA